MRFWGLLLAAALAANAAPPPSASPTPRPEFVQAVEFPYYMLPRQLWERELVWLKNIGVGAVEFSIPWNWHQTQTGEFDFTGRTSPRRDVTSFIRILRRLGMKAWIRPLGPVHGWLNNGAPVGSGQTAASQKQWLAELEKLLSTQTENHGGPVFYVEGRIPGVPAAAPPAPVTTVSVLDPDALRRGREALAGLPSGPHGSLVWTRVEDALYPGGWAVNREAPLVAGAVSFSGEEKDSTEPVRRNATLLREWARLLPVLRPVALPNQAPKLPPGVRAAELASAHGSAVTITNAGTAAFHGDLRVHVGRSKTTVTLPGITVKAEGSLWLPVGLSLGPDGLCAQCTNFSPDEHVVYATAELVSIEYENGILAMEFAAPERGEAVLQLARKPVGPYLAAGRPTEFDWDEKALRVKLPIPASTAPGNRVRVGLAVEEPETSAFFTDARRLVLGRPNLVSTMYSSPELADRSRLVVPVGYAIKKIPKNANEIDYEITPPADAVHGDFVNMALEADGMPLGRARVQVFRPVSVRLESPVSLRLGRELEIPADPPTAVVEPRAGTSVDIIIRNNAPEIQTYQMELAGDGLEFMPARMEVSVGAMTERTVSVRIFGEADAAGLRDWTLRLKGAATLEQPMRALLLPRNGTVAWSADLDGDGQPEWILESRTMRAVFSSQDGGRWLEFTWKNAGENFVPEQGTMAGTGPAEVRATADSLRFVGKDWQRTVRLSGETLSIEQTSPLPPGLPASEVRPGVELTLEQPSPGRAVYTLRQRRSE